MAAKNLDPDVSWTPLHHNKPLMSCSILPGSRLFERSSTPRECSAASSGRPLVFIDEGAASMDWYKSHC